MKIGYEHLLRFLIDKPSIEDISEKLFQLGHEHEVDDLIFDIEFTPNRGDCLSLYGLARDLNVFYETNLDIPIYECDIPKLDLNFINNCSDKCPHISFLKIQIKGDAPKYKDYLESYFKDFKINKNNFFTDVSNYVAYELGQPTHSYDFLSLGADITLQDNTDNAAFLTLLGNSIEIKNTDLVFTSERKIINLSGVIGGKNSACNEYTKNALIECAYFIPESIIGKSIKYNIHSDASHKFERGADPKCHERVLRRFIEIVNDHVEIEKLELYTNNYENHKDIELEFDLDKVNKILGTKITYETYKKVLINLGFKVDNNIRVPSYRSDINHQNDLAEEIARVIGYNNLPVTSINLDKKDKTLEVPNQELLKSFLIDNGFIEVINSSFCSHSSNNAIKVDNPLDGNRKYIRTNIIDSLTENLIYNENRQKDSVKLFEISDVYSLSQDSYQKRLALIISGRRGKNYIDFSKKLNKDYLINLFNEVDIDINNYIHSIDRGKLDSKTKTPIFAAEFNIDQFQINYSNFNFTCKFLDNFIQYEPISEFPSSFRDFSFLIKDAAKVAGLQKHLDSFNEKHIRESYMFDLFRNPKTGEIKLGYRFIFQSHEKTLTDQEIDKYTDNILESVLAIESVSLPGRD
jgi:phenylalanyl-tRNA synthetase beta chain